MKAGVSSQWGPSGTIRDHPPWLPVPTHLDIAQVGEALPHPEPIGGVNRATVQQRLVDLHGLQVGTVGEGLHAKRGEHEPRAPGQDGVGTVGAILNPSHS